MKYGETLRQRSIPAWSHHNIDYDDVKHLIKEHTTPGKGKTISVPGGNDEKLRDFERTLFAILADQHDRIDRFVKSKAGEIQRRLDHANRQLRQLSLRSRPTKDNRIPISRLEQYGKLENDVLKAGDEIRSLARFTSTQRTAFRKLLKKYKKWTGSAALETRFRDEVLDDPKSFTKLDLGHLLDQYSETLSNIRTLYESQTQQVSRPDERRDSAKAPVPSAVDLLRDGMRNGSRVEFDTAIATVPLGAGGEVANYFVHPDNVVELQVFLLQHLRYYTTRSRSSSVATPVSPSTPTAFFGGAESDADYFMLVADNRERFAQEQSKVTISQREHEPGRPPQMAKASVRWNNLEDAMLTARSDSTTGKIRSAALKKKHVDALFDRSAAPPKRAEVSDGDALLSIRAEILRDITVRPLYKVSSCRSRFTSINSDAESIALATLDTSITMQCVSDAKANGNPVDFPFAVLRVRKEGQAAADIINTLQNSHLVERVRGFSLQCHALWVTCKPKNMSPPFWMSMLSQDIRKLPPPAIKRNGTLVEGGSGTRSAATGSVSTASVPGLTDSTTAVETQGTTSTLPSQLDAPPLRSFRKKRRRTYAEEQEQQQKYWSEYDHPEEGDDGGYVIYIDPNEQSTLDRLFDRISGFFISQKQPDEEALLQSPFSPNAVDTSDEEDAAPKQRNTTYGTLSRTFTGQHYQDDFWPIHHNQHFLPQITIICFFASLSLLIVAYILATTSKHKFIAEVDVGIIFAICCSLALSVVGFFPIMRREHGTWASWWVAVGVLVADAMGSGGLLAWVLG